MKATTPPLTLARIRRNARQNPGFCAVCGRKLRTDRRGRVGFVCSKRSRKSCRLEYQAAYRALTRGGPRLYAITSVEAHPKRSGMRLARLACGHVREMTTGDAKAGRRKSHCPRCSTKAEARAARA